MGISKAKSIALNCQSSRPSRFRDFVLQTQRIGASLIVDFVGKPDV